jgi:hypothetical protein
MLHKDASKVTAAVNNRRLTEIRPEGAAAETDETQAVKIPLRSTTGRWESFLFFRRGQQRDNSTAVVIVSFRIRPRANFRGVIGHGRIVTCDTFAANPTLFLRFRVQENGQRSNPPSAPRTVIVHIIARRTQNGVRRNKLFELLGDNWRTQHLR